MFDSRSRRRRRTVGVAASSSFRIVMKSVGSLLFMLAILDCHKNNINTLFVDAWATSSSSSSSSASSSSSSSCGGGGGGGSTSASASSASLTTMLSSLINKAAPHSPNNIRRDNRNRNRNIRKYVTRLNSVADSSRRGGGDGGAGGGGSVKTAASRGRRTGRRDNRSIEQHPMTTTMTSSSSTTALSYSSQQQLPEGATQRTIRKTRKHKIYIVDRWNAMFDRLQQYKNEYGNTNVPKMYNDSDNKDNDNDNNNNGEQPNLPHLGNWVSKQRYEYSQVYQNTNGREGQITPERINKLESIGFVWELGRNDEWESKWLTNFHSLQSFQSKYNSTKVPILDNVKSSNNQNTEDEDYCYEQHPMSTLGRWVKTQRRQRNEYMRNEYVDDISFATKMKDRISLLNSINFEWLGKSNTEYDKWLGMYFKVLFCHTTEKQTTATAATTTTTTTTTGQHHDASVYSTRLAKWSEQQRQYYYENGGNNNNNNNKYLTQHQISLLNEIPNFDWGSNNKIIKTWNDNYNELVEYHTTYNSTLISTTVNENLGLWTQQQRIDYKSNTLSESKISKLNTLHFDFELNDINNHHDICWFSMYDRLLSYKNKYNTTVVPNHDGYDRPLANWVGNQRVKLGKYVTIDIDTDTDNNNVNDNSIDGNVNGNGNDDVNNNKFDKFDDYVLVQRIANDIGCNPTDEFPPRGFIQKLSPYKIAKRIHSLNKINFVWDVQDAQWYDMYQRYVDHVHDNDNDNDGEDSSTTTSLSNTNTNTNNELNLWIRVQRKQYQNNELSSKRIELLNKINFVWDPQSQHWLDMYNRLLDYKKQNNNSTLVSRSYTKDPDLGLWLHTQRRAYKRKTLSDERIQYLNSIDFIWEV